MGFSAQAGHVIFKTQATPGTIDPNLGTAGVAMKLRSGSLGTNRELMIPDAEIGGGRDVVDAYLGTVSNSGDYDFYARLGSFPTLLQAALGLGTSAAAAGVNTHTIVPSDAAQLPFLSIEEQIGNGYDAYSYLDGVVNTLHLEVDANGYLMGTAGIIAARRNIGITPTADPKWDDSPMIVGSNVTVTYDGVPFPAKSFSLDINNNFEDDNFLLGSFYLSDLTPKRREIMGSATVRETNKNFWRTANLGTAAATAPSGLATKKPLVVTARTYEVIDGTTTVAELVLTFPKVILKPYNSDVSGDDILETSIEWQAVRPVAAQPIMTAVAKNGSASIA